MNKLLLDLLRSYLVLGAEPPDNPDPPADPPADPPDDDDGEFPDLGEDDPEPAPSAADPNDPEAIRKELAAERAAREKAEREYKEASERLAASERARSAPAPQPSEEQKLFEQEETRLKASDITPLEKWQIESSRALRAQTRAANMALWESREIADKADFDRWAAANPGIAKKYTERVEKKLAELRANGQNLPRKIALKMLIGEDIVDGKVKSSKRAAPEPRTVDRGKPAAARSDVRARAAASERDKRRARLENQVI